MKLDELFNGKNPINADKLNQKLELATHILNHEMAPRKKKAILNFLKGMVELNKRDEKIFERRLAEIIAEHPEMRDISD